MAQKQCTECGESVDEAKAFCPQCGNAFVEEEKREEASVFDSMEGTMQFGQTMYNQMLSDMGLNIKDLKVKDETVKPSDLEATQQPSFKPSVEVLKPIATEVKRPNEVPAARNKLLIFGIVGAFVILLLVIAVVAGVLLWTRFG